jgi:hypothetical protein
VSSNATAFYSGKAESSRSLAAERRHVTVPQSYTINSRTKAIKQLTDEEPTDETIVWPLIREYSILKINPHKDLKDLALNIGYLHGDSFGEIRGGETFNPIT